MAQIKIRHVLLALFIAAASSNLHQVYSLAVSHRGTSAVSLESPVNVLAQPVPVITKSSHFKRFIHVNDTNIISSASPTIATKHLLDRADADGADAVRTAASSSEWISTLVDTVVMAMLALASIVVAVVLGCKQLRATQVQLQLMFDASRHLNADNIALNNLENVRVDCGHARPEIVGVGVDPSGQADLSAELPGFPLEPRSYSFGDDQLPQAVTTDHDTNTQFRRAASEDGFAYNGSQQRGDEGQTHGKVMPAAGSCIQLDRQDSRTRDLHDRRRSV